MTGVGSRSIHLRGSLVAGRRRTCLSHPSADCDMYGLPEDFDASIFVERTLEQICFNENQIALHFGLDLSLVIECAFIHEDPAQQPSNQVVDVPAASSNLMSLLGVRVTLAWGDKDGTLLVRFENGQSLKIEDNSPVYESYRIQQGDREIIV